MKIKKMVYYGLFAALTGVLSQIALPLPFTPVPVNLALASVLIAGGMLGPTGGMMSQLLYVLLGVIGVPVFAKFASGPGILVGPTGGYIAGYILAALVAGALIRKSPKNGWLIAASMAVGVVVCYLLGTAYFMMLTKNNLTTALALCVTPFIPGDLFKIGISALTVKKMKGLNL